jgi:subtilisin family serine protease
MNLHRSMRMLFIAVLLTLTTASLASEAGFVPGEVLVFSRPEVPLPMGLLGQHFKQGVSIRRIAACDAWLVTIPEVKGDPQMGVKVFGLLAHQFGEAAEVHPNRILRGDSGKPVSGCTPGSNWGLAKTKQKRITPLPDASGVTVAVVDTGVRNSGLRLWKNPREEANGADDDGNGIADDLHGADFTRNPPSGRITDLERHGTPVAGIISEMTGYRAAIMPVRVLDHNRYGSDVSVAEGIDYAVSKGASIINLSLSIQERSPCTERALEKAAAAGALIVASAGSGDVDADQSPRYPAANPLPAIISVTATTKEDRRAAAPYGACSVDLGAPGDAICTLFPDDTWWSLYGTSAAAPFVSGAAALLKAACPEASALQIKEVLLQTVDKVGGLVTVSGGRLHALRAVEAWRQRCPEEETP